MAHDVHLTSCLRCSLDARHARGVVDFSYVPMRDEACVLLKEHNDYWCFTHYEAGWRHDYDHDFMGCVAVLHLHLHLHLHQHLHM